MSSMGSAKDGELGRFGLNEVRSEKGGEFGFFFPAPQRRHRASRP